jgi:hypothetical protein
MKTQKKEQDKGPIMGKIGRFGYFGLRVELPYASYSFNGDYQAEMDKLISKSNLAICSVSTQIPTADNVTSSFYQIADSCVQISGNKKKSTVFIFNRNDNKREKTLSLLEEIFN